jgi:LysR family transcriptional activator of nhaA
MAWLNYHHLLYFWTVARTGSVTKACQELHLTQPAVSAQIRMLERSLGEKLFVKRGRNLAMTDVGRLVYRYADEIFVLGREMQETLAGLTVGRPQRLSVGVADQVHKIAVFRLLEPALNGAEPVNLVIKEDKLDRLLGDLALHNLDLVISDAPVGTGTHVKVTAPTTRCCHQSSSSTFVTPMSANHAFRPSGTRKSGRWTRARRLTVSRSR